MTSAATPSTMTRTAKIRPKVQAESDGTESDGTVGAEASNVPFNAHGDVLFNAHGGVLHHPGMPKTNAEQIAQEQRSWPTPPRRVVSCARDTLAWHEHNSPLNERGCPNHNQGLWHPDVTQGPRENSPR